MLDIFFNSGKALMFIFKLGIEIENNSFLELSESEYEQLNSNSSEKLYKIETDKFENLIYVSEAEKESLLKAKSIIDKFSEDSKQEFNSYEEKLQFVAKVIPKVFSEGTDYSRKE
jgi:hypothetical protein